MRPGQEFVIPTSFFYIGQVKLTVWVVNSKTPDVRMGRVEGWCTPPHQELSPEVEFLVFLTIIDHKPATVAKI